MKLQFDRYRIIAASDSILRLSRNVRTSRYELEEVRRQLRKQTELKKCLIELNRQQEAMEMLTARLVSLSTALREVTDLYDRTETRNEELLEGQKNETGWTEEPKYGIINGRISNRINQILYR